MDPVLVHDISSAATGDRDAYAKLVTQYQSVVCAISLSILHDVAASEDVAQEVFLAAWAGLPRLRDKGRFLPWLRQLARNQSYEHLRRRRRHVPLLEAGEPPDPALSLLERALERERDLVLGAALHEIPEDAREVITLYYREDGSIERCAALLGLTDAAVKQRLSRARQRLRESVESRFAATAKQSAPGPALGAAIIAQLSLSPAAQAAGLVVSAAKSEAPLHIGWLMAQGAGLGAAAALASAYLVVRALLRRAKDAEERQGILQFGAAQAATALAAGVALSFPWPGVSRLWQSVLVTSLYFATLAALGFLWLPRITARRLAMEQAADPEAFQIRQRRERIYGALGWTAGLLCAGLGVYFGVKSGG